MEFEALLKSWMEPGVHFEYEQFTPMVSESSVEPSDPFWSTISSVFVSKGLGYSIETFPGATDSRFIRAADIPAYGISPFNNTPILLHDHDEYIHKDVYLAGIETYIEIISKLASL